MTKKEEIKQDAVRLGEIISELRELVGELQEMSEKYDIPELKQLIEFDATCLSNVNHTIVKTAEKLRKKWTTDHV